MANIAVDIDDTLYSFTDEAREQLSLMIDEPEYEEYKDQLTHALYATWDQWRTPFELCGFDKDGKSLWVDHCIARCHDDDAILRQQPFNGASDVCQELLAEGHRLTYISNRATTTEDATWRWLVENDFTNSIDVDDQDSQVRLVITDGDKRPFIKDCQYMIDDRVKNVLEFIYDYEYESERREYITATKLMGMQNPIDQGKRKAFVRVSDYNGSLTDVPGLYLAHTWSGLRRYLVKNELLPKRQLVEA